MDQLKEILKQAIRYRFWIAVGLSALLPMIAYIAGSGPIKDKAKAEEATITGAHSAVKPYASGTPVNRQYAEQVSTKTEELSKDVDQSWKMLYDRQAPLLTWPETVQTRFNTWGRQWPKEVDSSAVQIAIIDYVNVYPKFVTEVYKSFQPFDYVEGTGIVAAPPEEALLRPAKFSEQDLPSLGKVWGAQERLWIQRTMLDVVANVNKTAKSWDSAIIKQITALEVGNANAQDQRSIAKSEVLEEAPDITDPAKPAVATASPEGASSGGAATTGSMGSGMYAAQSTEGVFYIKSDSPAFKVMPVQMSVLIDQDHISDFLVACENSPMTIQVRDFEMSKPAVRVQKPEKGAQSLYGFGGSGMMMNYESFMSQNRTQEMFGGMAATTGMMDARMMGGGGMYGPAAISKKGVDVRSKDREKERIEAEKKARNVTVTSHHDPYYNIVEVKVYGQARFFVPPPVAAAAPSLSAPAEAATTPPPADAAAAATAEKKVEEPAAKPEAEKKAEAGEAEKKPEAEKKAEEPAAKPEAEKKAEEPAAKPEAEKKGEEPAAKPDAEKKAEEPAAKPEEAAAPKSF